MTPYYFSSHISHHSSTLLYQMFWHLADTPIRPYAYLITLSTNIATVYFCLTQCIVNSLSEETVYYSLLLSLISITVPRTLQDKYLSNERLNKEVWKMHNVLKELLISLLMLNWWKIKLKQQASPDHVVPWMPFREK